MRKDSILAALFCVLVCAACSGSSSGDADGFDPSPRYITDEQGRALILHGVNVSNEAKVDPLRLPAIDESDAERIAIRYGFNLVRYLIFWDAIEPRPGEFNLEYLESVSEHLDFFAARGVYVVLDMHQDVYAARFCCDGAPEWAIRDDGQPFSLQPSWFLNYFQPAVIAAFDNFWDTDGPHADLQQHYAMSWQEVARSLGDHSAVLGYDLMNEPFPGSDVSTLELLGGVDPESRAPDFDRGKLQPFYERLTEAIREVDQEGWIFLEPRFGGPGNGGPSYLERFEDPRKGPSRIAYFPHLYSTNFELSQNYDAETDPFLENWARERARDMEILGGPLLIGEWGLSPHAGGADQLYRESVELADRMTSGWAYWSYDAGGWGPWNPDGSDQAHADILVRAYPRRVAGEPTSYGYDQDTRCLSLDYADRRGVQGPTEIYIPEARHYGNSGWQLHVQAEQWTSAWDASREVLEVDIPPGGGLKRIFVTPPLACGDLFSPQCSGDPQVQSWLAEGCLP